MQIAVNDNGWVYTSSNSETSLPALLLKGKPAIDVSFQSIIDFINEHNNGSTGKAKFDLRVWSSIGNMYAQGIEIRDRKTREVASFRVNYEDAPGDDMKVSSIEYKGTHKASPEDDSLYI
jgi:hypothetical protein